MAKPSPIDGLDAGTPFGEAARRTLAVRLFDVRTLCDRVHRARDAGGIHDLRVATRRLRAALELYGGGLAAEAEVGRLGDALGEVRDLDVQLEWLAEAAAKAGARGDAEEAGIRALADERRRVLADREHALGQAIARFVDESAAPLEESFGGVDAPGRLGGRMPRRRLRRRLRALEQPIADALESTDARTAHRLRIAVKKLRYDAELLEPAHPDEIGAILDALVPLQETLGDLHDRDVRLELVVRFVARATIVERAGACALITEELAARDRLAAELAVELRRWEQARVIRALRRPLK